MRCYSTRFFRDFFLDSDMPIIVSVVYSLSNYHINLYHMHNYLQHQSTTTMNLDTIPIKPREETAQVC